MELGIGAEDKEADDESEDDEEDEEDDVDWTSISGL